MYGYGGNDQLGSDADFARIYGGSGDDILYYTGPGNSKLYGEAGNDMLYGGSQNDKLFGGGGGDWMFGGEGKNVFKGGGGPDHFGFNADPANTEIAKIKDFNPKKDFLNFQPFFFPLGDAGETIDKSQFRKGGKPKDEDDNFGYKPGNGLVWVDLNGSDPGGFHKIAKVGEDLNISYMNFQF
jgi:Ca2+-binding RTX toxin-like protein